MSELTKPEANGLQGNELREAANNLASLMKELIPNCEKRLASGDIKYSGGDVIRIVAQEYNNGDTKYTVEAEAPEDNRTLDAISISKKRPGESVLGRVQIGDIPQIFYFREDRDNNIVKLIKIEENIQNKLGN